MFGVSPAWAQTQEFSQTATIQAPANAYGALVQLWGGGGGGSKGNGPNKAGGGGGGGGYVKALVTVSPGQSYTVTVSEAVGQETNGGVSSFTGDNNETATAEGGKRSVNRNGGDGGGGLVQHGAQLLAAWSGGNGGSASNANNQGGGGGGEGGGATQAGSSGSSNSGATGGAGGEGGEGGDGGDGGNANGNGLPGNVRGGGGGGAGSAGDIAGGGGGGHAIITWILCGPPAFTGPAGTCPTDIYQDTDPGECGAIVTYAVSATGLAPITYTYSHPSGSFFPLGTTHVIVTASNECGISTCTFEVVVEDNEPPVAQCFNHTVPVVLNSHGSRVIHPGFINDGSFDACMIDTMYVDPVYLDCEDVGEQVVTLTVIDAAGNVAQCQGTIYVLDGYNPDITCTGSTISLDENGQAFVTPEDVGVTVSDECGIDRVELRQSSFDCSHLGENQVIVDVWDVNGRWNYCVAYVIVEDNIAPDAQFRNDIILTLDSQGEGSIDLDDLLLTWIDNCEIGGYELSRSEFNCIDLGINLVEVHIWDIDGNADSALVEVDVRLGPPIAICPYPYIVYAGLDPDGMVFLPPEALLGDMFTLCELSLYYTYSLSQELFDCTDIGGPHTVSLTATDSEGNTSQCEMAVVIVDDIPPVVNCGSVVLFLNEEGQATISPDDVVEGYWDNCGEVQIELQQTHFDCADLGVQAFYAWGYDVSGNSGSCVYTVDVRDDPENPVCEIIPWQVTKPSAPVDPMEAVDFAFPGARPLDIADVAPDGPAMAAFPNPFGEEVTLTVSLQAEEWISVRLFDFTGHLVGVVYEGILAGGDHHLWFDATKLTAGQYRCMLRSGTFVESIDMIRLE